MRGKLLQIKECKGKSFTSNYSVSYYSVLFFQGKGNFCVDFVNYSFSGATVLFLSPYQNFQWLGKLNSTIKLLQFHADFYCIEYHKKEVACNGLLFNNIYLLPHIFTSSEKFIELHQIINKIDNENKCNNPFSDAVLKSYLQLILALCSKEKNIQLSSRRLIKPVSKEIIDFQNLLDVYFLKERSSSFYAAKLAMSPNIFSKKIKLELNKTPTKIIKERVILEAKKLLHLTTKSVKEIAFELNFEDQFYFSRYFKKAVGLSPIHYRDKVGISIVAK